MFTVKALAKLAAERTVKSAFSAKELVTTLLVPKANSANSASQPPTAGSQPPVKPSALGTKGKAKPLPTIEQLSENTLS